MWCDCVYAFRTKTTNSDQIHCVLLVNLYAKSPKLRAPLGPHQSKIPDFHDFLATRHKIGLISTKCEF